ncbi:MAG: Na/Pi cotransporter family protein, partial [Spirochaetaceae bacterium]
ITIRLVPGADEHDLTGPYVLPVSARYAQGAVELYLMEVRHEIVRMAGIVDSTIRSAWKLFENPHSEDAEKQLETCRIGEEYTDQMQEQLSRFLASFSTESLSDGTATSIASLLRIIDELEGTADSSYNVALIADRTRRKNVKVDKTALEELRPYAQLVQEFVGFIEGRMLDTLDDEALQEAHEIERSINRYRNKLKKSARKRIQKGSDVKAELVVIDVIGHFEHMGDYSLNVAQALRQMNPRRTMQASLRMAPEASPPQVGSSTK